MLLETQNQHLLWQSHTCSFLPEHLESGNSELTALNIKIIEPAHSSAIIQ